MSRRNPMAPALAGELGEPARCVTMARANSVTFEDDGAPGVVIEMREDVGTPLMRLSFTTPEEATAFLEQLVSSMLHAWPRLAKSLDGRMH